jgi:hypothetical protein
VLWPKIGRVGPTCQAGLGALDTLNTASDGDVDKMVFENASTHGRLAKVMWSASHTLARLSPFYVPCHFLMSYCL